MPAHACGARQLSSWAPKTVRCWTGTRWRATRAIASFPRERSTVKRSEQLWFDTVAAEELSPIGAGRQGYLGLR